MTTKGDTETQWLEGESPWFQKTKPRHTHGAVQGFVSAPSGGKGGRLSTTILIRTAHRSALRTPDISAVLGSKRLNLRFWMPSLCLPFKRS